VARVHCRAPTTSLTDARRGVDKRQSRDRSDRLVTWYWIDETAMLACRRSYAGQLVAERDRPSRRSAQGPSRSNRCARSVQSGCGRHALRSSRSARPLERFRVEVDADGCRRTPQLLLDDLRMLLSARKEMSARFPDAVRYVRAWAHGAHPRSALGKCRVRLPDAKIHRAHPAGLGV
jgi:hypothetical protein